MNTIPSDSTASRQNPESRYRQLRAEYDGILAQGLSLDLTRGKPSSEQLALSDSLDGLLNGDYRAADGTDCRNYGGNLGIPEARKLAGELLQCRADQCLVAGNSSLQLMYQCVLYNHLFSSSGTPSWQEEAAGESIKFLCPSPGYDRHFAICEALGIHMIPVSLGEDGPDMDEVENHVRSDHLVKGIWCVPKYSNPSGIVYGDSKVKRLAGLARLAGDNFRVFWDNAYAVHDLVEKPRELANILSLCEQLDTLDSIYAFGSTSKITFAGSGLAFMAGSAQSLKALSKHLSYVTIGPDKVNQLRHVRFLRNRQGVEAHMAKHRALLKPKFDLVLELLDNRLGNCTVKSRPAGTWTRPEGGYFVLFDTQPGLAREIVTLTGDAGVKLTPAGATWPYGKDPDDRNIRIAPSFPTLGEIRTAMEVFTLCVELATLRRALES